MRDALDGAPRATCRMCGNEIALVDRAVNVKKKTAKGGKWVHVELPPSVHLAAPELT